MYLPKPERNQYTIGKHLRCLKGLRRADQTAEIVPMPQQLQEYTQELLGQGLIINKLTFARFRIKNGLPYCGLISEDKISANTILLRVPVDSLLTTRNAYLSDLQQIYLAHPQFFSQKYSYSWQDRILLFYLLYEYQKGKQSPWYNLIRNLPREIDYVIHWSNDQLELLEDPFVMRAIVVERENIRKENEEMQRIAKKYPQFFDTDTVSLQNIRWIHTHLVTRCFGKHFTYTTLVPFAQLFNHQCTDVYYTMDYKEGNPHTEGQVFYEEKELNEKDLVEVESSDGSYEEDDYHEDQQWIEGEQQKVFGILEDKSQEKLNKQSNHLQEQIQKCKNNVFAYSITFISFNDSISLFYLMGMLTELDRTLKMKDQSFLEKLDKIHASNVFYVKLIKQFYSKMLDSSHYTYGLKQKKSLIDQKKQKAKQTAQKIRQMNTQYDVNQSNEKYFKQDWPKDKFDEFLMLCSTKDQFEKHAQVFFCYGRLPNKLLLMRYGFALEHNKYDHLFLRIDCTELVKQCKPMRRVISDKDIAVNKYCRFKVKRTKICLELLAYIRAELWTYGNSIEQIFYPNDPQLELKILHKAKQIYQREMDNYSHSIVYNQQLLTDSSLNYHQYFATVYKLQQQRILHQQIQLLSYAEEVIVMMKHERKSLRDVLERECQEGKLRMQIMMEKYFEGLRVVCEKKQGIIEKKQGEKKGLFQE